MIRAKLLPENFLFRSPGTGNTGNPNWNIFICPRQTQPETNGFNIMHFKALVGLFVDHRKMTKKLFFFFLSRNVQHVYLLNIICPVINWTTKPFFTVGFERRQFLINFGCVVTSIKRKNKKEKNKLY